MLTDLFIGVNNQNEHAVLNQVNVGMYRNSLRVIQIEINRKKFETNSVTAEPNLKSFARALFGAAAFAFCAATGSSANISAAAPASSAVTVVVDFSGTDY